MHLETAEYFFARDGQIIGFYPHMYFRGIAFRYELRQPSGKQEMILDVPRFDSN